MSEVSQYTSNSTTSLDRSLANSSHRGIKTSSTDPIEWQTLLQLRTMNLEVLFEAQFGAQAQDLIERAISWTPEELLPNGGLNLTDREALHSQFVQFKQKLISEALISMFKVSNNLRSVSPTALQDCINAATKGSAKAENERWFLDELHRFRLATTTLQDHIQHLIDVYCVPSMALPFDLKPIKTEIEGILRQHRTNFKQKVRKSFRKLLSQALPANFLEFQHQVVGCIAAALGNDMPHDIAAKYAQLSSGCVQFLKSVFVAFVDPERLPQFDFLQLDHVYGEPAPYTNGSEEEDGEDESMNVEQTSASLYDHVSGSDSKKRPHSDVSVEVDDEDDDENRKKPHRGTRK